MEFSYTKHQVPRGSRPDAVVGDNIYLIKYVTAMRLTYQIRLLAWMAQSKNKRLIIRLPQNAIVHQELMEFVRTRIDFVEIERVK